MGRENGQPVRISQAELKRLQKIDHEIVVLRRVNNELVDVINKITDAVKDRAEASQTASDIIVFQLERTRELFENQRVMMAHQEPVESPTPAKRTR